MAAVKAGIKAMIADKRPLTPDEAAAALKDLFGGEATQAQTGAFLVALQTYPLNPEVLKACAESMRSFAQPCDVPDQAELVDVVGTGGDGMDTFNVSTAAGMVIAALGIKVAKHGNRSASGSVGSADFLEALGCKTSLDGQMVAGAVKECGFGFLFAPMFHPAMKHVGPARKEIGVRTIFNLLGPLTNPANPGLQVIGVGKKDLGMLFAELFKLKGAKKAMIVHSSEGLDEISPSASTFVWLLQDGKIAEKEITPQDFGLKTHPIELVQGGSAEDRAAIFRQVISGERGEAEESKYEAVRDYIIINAAAAIFLAGKAESYEEAAQKALGAISSGATRRVLEAYAAYTQRS